jgi:hypothetical protein
MNFLPLFLMAEFELAIGHFSSCLPPCGLPVLLLLLGYALCAMRHAFLFFPLTPRALRLTAFLG